MGGVHVDGCGGGYRYDIGGRPASELPAGLLDRLFGPELDALHPYGVDPVFLPSSKLYDSGLKDKVSYYYDTRNGSGEVSATGAPYAHFPRPLPGYTDGFPLLLPDSLSVGRMEEMVTFLKVGCYLTAWSDEASFNTGCSSAAHAQPALKPSL